MLLSWKTHRILPAILVAATILFASVAVSGPTGHAGLPPVEYTRRGYDQVDQLCSLLFEFLQVWRDPAKSHIRTGVERRGGEIGGNLAAMAMSGAIDASVFPPHPWTIDSFKRLASATEYPKTLGVFVFDALRQAKSARPPQSVTDMQDARARVADYAIHCTFGGIASLQERVTR